MCKRRQDLNNIPPEKKTNKQKPYTIRFQTENTQDNETVQDH